MAAETDMRGLTTAQGREISWEHLARLADRIAERIVEKWEVVECDDVRQVILEYAFRNRKSIAVHVRDEAMLRRILYMVGQAYAVKERDYRDLVDGQYYFTTAEARCALRELAKSPEDFGGTIGHWDDLTRCDIDDNMYVTCMEVKKCLGCLSPRHRKLVVDHYILGRPLLTKSERRACQRGVVALAREMNRSVRRVQVPA